MNFIKQFFKWFWNKRNNSWEFIGCEIFLEGLGVGILIILGILYLVMLID